MSSYKQRCHILIVDDEATILDSYQKILGEHHELTLSQDPLKALKLIEENSYDILITDIKMPEMDGVTLMKKAFDLRPELLVILITGYPDLKDAVALMQEGAFHYLTKPFTPRELTDTVQRATMEIQKQQASREDRKPTRIIEREVPAIQTKEPPWMHHYRRKLCTAEEAVSIIEDKQTVYMSANAATPLAMERALAARADDFSYLKLVHVLLAGEDILKVEEPGSPFHHLSLFVGPADRKSVNEGISEYVPVFLYEIPGLYTSGKVSLDVAIVQVSPPDNHGFVSIGVECLASLAACECATQVIAQVNDRMPYILGDNFVHVSRFDRIVEVDEDILELHPRKATEVEEKIGFNVASLIEDGATLQMGIGGIPDAVLRYLDDKKDLGVHTEMVSDGLIGAVEKGIITNRRKSLHKNKIIATFVYGTRNLYDFVHQNPLLELHPVNYTNNPFIIAQNDNMTAINSAVEVDITGQICSDSIGTRIYSGFGGQVDFIRGAASAKGGKPIIALPSTTKNDTISRIVPKLKPGAGVVTTRADVHYLVTEFGVVDLHGKSLHERAHALIEISHPNFHDELIAEAKERRCW